MIYLNQIRHMCPEKQITIDRPLGRTDYTFIHFISSVEVVIEGVSVMTEPHTCLIYSPHVKQYYRSATPIIHDWFHFTMDDPAFFEGICLPTDILLLPSHSEFVTPIVKEMEYEFLSDKTMGDTLISTKAIELFIKLSRAVNGEAPYSVSTDTEERFRDLRSSIFSSLSHQWSVPEMASRVGLSPSRFYSSYRSVFGTSPMNDLILARIDAAKNALSFTNAPIYEISEGLGYGNVTHFVRQFRSLTGLSPNQYRKSSRSV